MEKLKVKYLILIILFSITAAVASSLQYDATQDDKIGLSNLKAIPMEIGNWRGNDVYLDDRVYEILETKAIIHRSFVSEDGEEVFLSIVHYNDTKVDFHSPEACIGGRGLKTVKTTQSIQIFSGGKMRIMNVAKMITARASGQTLTYYFFKSGHFLGSNYIKMRLSIASNKLTNNDTRGSLIRISTNFSEGKKDLSEKRLNHFLEDLFPYIEKQI